ncbi:hypothetical protein [Yinghuangia sp. YIM S10712]|uniref:hypothetical protein n=1 Tax=Yinghuangia sp. YIM S10712 TaxID=3436930 RepID=UPI003F53408F
MNTQDDNASKPAVPTAAELLAATAPTARGGQAVPPGASPSTLEDTLGITESPSARTLRAAADAEPGVRSRSCLIRTDETPGGVRVIVSIAVAYGLAVHEVAHRVRRRVAAAAVDLFGTAPESVTVDVKVVWLDEPADRPASH